MLAEGQGNRKDQKLGKPGHDWLPDAASEQESLKMGVFPKREWAASFIPDRVMQLLLKPVLVMPQLPDSIRSYMDICQNRMTSKDSIELKRKEFKRKQITMVTM